MDGLLVRADKPPALDQHQPGDSPFLRDIQLCDRFLITKSRLPYIHRSLHSHVIRVRVVGDFCRGDTSCGPPENGSCASGPSASASAVGFPGGLRCGDRGDDGDHPRLTSTYGPFCLVAATEVRGMVVAHEVPARGHAVPPRWRILVLRSFASASKGPNISAQGIAQGGVGIAVGVTRRPRGARRGSPDPAGLPDRQVSRAHRRPRFQRCSCLLSLLQTKETYRSSIWAGSGDPRPERVRA
jgi:hypothetical protein